MRRYQMNNNESLNMSRGGSSDLPDADCAAMTAEELALYKEVLEAAYPKPKRDIKAGVMKAVRRDAAVKKKQKELRPLIMRWGGLAASIVLVAAIGIRVLPAFLTDNLTVSDEAAAEAIEQTAEASVYSTKSADLDGAFTEKRSPATIVLPETNSVTEEAEEAVEDAVYDVYSAEPAAHDDAIIEEAVSEAPTADAAEAAPEAEIVIEEAVIEEPAAEMVIEEAPAAEEAVEEAPVIMYAANPTTEDHKAEIEEAPEETAEEALVITSECTHKRVFFNSWHRIPDILIEEVGVDRYAQWCEEVKNPADPCTVNIRSFLEHFEISEEMFTMYLLTTDIAYYCDYPPEVLYTDAASCENYYSAGGSYDKMIADNFEYTLKLALRDEISDEEYEAWLAKFPYPTVRAWSISEFVTDHSIPEYRFLEIYNEVADDYKAEHDVEELHSYDTTKLYVPAFGIKFALAASQYGYNADVSCRK